MLATMLIAACKDAAAGLARAVRGFQGVFVLRFRLWLPLSRAPRVWKPSVNLPHQSPRRSALQSKGQPFVSSEKTAL